MPLPGKRWRHVTISTVNSWLPGDRRGFRTRGHKLHSSGDYKNSPPRGEHGGLHRYSQQISGAPVVIPRAARLDALRAIRARLEKLDHRVLTIAVAGMHAHLLVELPDDLRAIKAIIGQCKTSASHAIRSVRPGRVWARDGDYEPVDDPAHHRRAFGYILEQDNAWVWAHTGVERFNPSKSGR